MKCIICSVAPVFPKEVHGGSGRVLVDVAVALGTAGHQVEIFCTRRHDNHEEFRLHSNVLVRPVLRFKETYPEPFYVPPHQLAEVVRLVRSAVENADVCYIHDGELPFHFVYDNVPTVIAFQDFVYPDTLSSGMSFARDTLIVASEYVKQCVEDSVGQYRLGLASRMHVIRNGIDLALFDVREPLAWQTDLKKRGFYLIGCPHRPDPTKGLTEGVQLIARLKSQTRKGKPEPMLLIPRWMDSRINANDGHVYRTLYSSLRETADTLGVGENIYIHEWLGGNELPRYYSGCDVVIAIGTFVEAFGNVPVEAAACGVASVVVKIGGHVGKLPASVCAEICPADIDEACDAVVRMRSSEVNLRAIREYIREHYSLNQMVAGYRSVLESATRQPALPLRISTRRHVKLAAWCRFIGTRVYNDYLREYSDDPALCALFDPIGGNSRVVAENIPRKPLLQWLEGGYVVECD